MARTKVVTPKIELNAGPFIPAWTIFVLYSLVGVGAVWLATSWMLNGISLALITTAVAIAALGARRLSPLLTIMALALTAQFFMVPAGAEVTGRTFVLAALIIAVFRLYGGLTLVGLKTEVALAVVWEQLKIFLILTSAAYLVLVCLLLVSPGQQGQDVGWMYVVGAALIVVTVICGFSLRDSQRLPHDILKGI